MSEEAPRRDGDWIEHVKRAASAVTGITQAQIDDDLFDEDGKKKSRNGEALFKRWKASLDKGEPDWKIYVGPDYLLELLYCWNVYSGPSAVRLISNMLDEGITVSSSHDFQGGIGQTTALLAKSFPHATHTLTAGSKAHGELAEKLFSFLNVTNVVVRVDDHSHGYSGMAVDLLVAQETFEHFPGPLPVLEQLLDQCRPRHYFDASSFELVGSPGHFPKNKDIRPAFNRVLEDRGYKQAWTDEHFDDGFTKKKTPGTKPTLWSRRGT